MIDFIASKEVNPKGQLDVVDDLPVEMSILGTIWHKKSNTQDIIWMVLVGNQYKNTQSILALGRINLVFSSGHFAEKLSKAILSSDEANPKETIATHFLMNSIVYYNASFDYLKALIRFRFSSHAELIKDFPKDKIEKELGNLNLSEQDWQLALVSIITKNKEKFDKWLNNNKIISDPYKKLYNELGKKNEDLRIKYQANQLKHGAVPNFRRSDPGNLYGSRYFISLDQFYLKNNMQFSIKFGCHYNSLKIDKTQEFLIDYNNKTVEIMKSLELSKIFS